MTWTYLQPRSSTVAATPGPTDHSWNVATGAGSKFLVGLATIAGDTCSVLSVTGDAVVVAKLPFVPVSGAEMVQYILGAKDKVRLLCGDTDTDDQQLQDEEIDGLLTVYPNVFRASALACDTLAAKFSRKADYQIYQEISEKLSQQATSYRKQADRLRLEASKTSAFPFAGGVLQIDKDTALADFSKVKPFFTRLMMSEPGTHLSEDSDAQTAAFRTF